MSMVLGTGPFGHQPAGAFDGSSPVQAGAEVRYLERSPKRVRAVVDGQVVVDSREPRMLFASKAMPEWWFPAADVVEGALEFRRGEDELLDGLLALPQEAEVTWWEDDEEVVGHPRDPYHRIDTRRSTERVTVKVGGEVVAESSHPVRLYETGLPVRFYIPEADVHDDVLGPSGLHTTCPYKGIAQYRSVTGGGTTVADAAWYYHEPLLESEHVRDLLSFLGEGVEVLVDGEPAPGM